MKHFLMTLIIICSTLTVIAQTKSSAIDKANGGSGCINNIHNFCLLAGFPKQLCDEWIDCNILVKIELNNLKDSLEAKTDRLERNLGLLEIEVKSPFRELVHSQTNFTTNSGTWTVMQSKQKIKYKSIGKLMIINIDIEGSVISSSTTSLEITIPNNGIAKDDFHSFVLINNSGMREHAWIRTDKGSNKLKIVRLPAALYVTGSIKMFGQITIEIQ